MKLDAARSEFAADHCYLNTAVVGLAPSEAVRRMEADLDSWRRGRIDIVAYDEVIDVCRAAYASLAGGVSADDVAIVSQLSVATAMVAAALRPGDEVLVAEEDFTSVLFPLFDRERDGVNVRVVPLADVLAEIRSTTTLVAVSAVQSCDGTVFDLDALAETVDGTATMTFVDATHAAGWLPIGADRFTVTAAAAYKWLCCPRGTGFMSVAEPALERIRPVAANWYAGEFPWQAAYGPPMRLATGARRFDVSPAWNAWVGAGPAMELLATIGADEIHRHNVELANSCRAGLDLEPSDSAIVTVDRADAAERLRTADISASAPTGTTRLAFHLYNTEADVDRVVDALT